MQRFLAVLLIVLLLTAAVGYVLLQRRHAAGLAAVEAAGAERVQEYARTSNVPSCRMIERCGLRLRPDVRSGIAQPIGARSFTR